MVFGIGDTLAEECDTVSSARAGVGLARRVGQLSLDQAAVHGACAFQPAATSTST
jgi:hypothetical protein